jgi:hypothetical protein
VAGSRNESFGKSRGSGTRRAIAAAMFSRGSIRGREAKTPQGPSAPQRLDLAGTGLAWVAQLVERVLGKDEVTGSIPVPGSRICWYRLDGDGQRKDLPLRSFGAKDLGELGRG